MAKISMPYRPVPVPPNTTSPNCINTIGTAPPSGVNESCMPFTAPQEAAVVMAANSPVAAMPKRVSLPSMLPPLCVALTAGSAPSADSSGLPCCSCAITTTTATTKIAVIAAINVQAWRMSPSRRPNMNTSAAGIRKIDNICRKLVSGVGFS